MQNLSQLLEFVHTKYNITKFFALNPLLLTSSTNGSQILNLKPISSSPKNLLEL